MAMNYHMEARRRQRFMERVCEARKRLAAGAAAPDGNDQRLQCGMINSCTSQSDPVISTDQGQFYQSRPSQLKELKDQKVFSGVVFKELIHDPNFYYRSAIEIGEEPPLHVNPIYKIIYPGAVAEQEDENVEQYPLASFSQSKKTENVPKLNPCPPSLKNIKRDNIYKILHPHTDY